VSTGTQVIHVRFFVKELMEKKIPLTEKSRIRKRAREGEVAAFLATTNMATKECMKTTLVG